MSMTAHQIYSDQQLELEMDAFSHSISSTVSDVYMNIVHSILLMLVIVSITVIGVQT